MDQPPHTSSTKKQLLGWWRSDSKRTLAELTQRRDITKKSFDLFRKIFGKLEVQYRPATFVYYLDGKTSTYKYKLLGADSYRVAILFDQKPPFAGPKLQTITFEDDYFWIITGRGIREHFKRVTPINSPRKTGKPIDLKRWIGKGKGGLKKMGYKSGDDFIREIRGGKVNPANA